MQPAQRLKAPPTAVCDFTRAQKRIESRYRWNVLRLLVFGGKRDRQVIFSLLPLNPTQLLTFRPSSTDSWVSISDDENDKAPCLKTIFCALDGETAAALFLFHESALGTSQATQPYEMGNIRFAFDQEINGNVYASVIGRHRRVRPHRQRQSNYFKPSFADFGRHCKWGHRELKGTTGIAAAGKFLSELDWSPLWVTT